jgi:hypothetical protein
MKNSIKIVLMILGVLALIPICYFAFWYFMMIGLFHSIDKSKAVGQKYMDSMTDKDIQVWMERTKKFLDEHGHGETDIYRKDVPPELAQLGILGIHKDTNYVSYIWVGGFDHTELDIKRMPDGSFQFTAMYNDESNKVIWPRATDTKNSQTNLTFQLIK